jgi:hypothetical protein
VRLERLTPGHVAAAVAALALLLIMAMDWYGSEEADLAHRVQSPEAARGADSGVVARAVIERARYVIARDEKNAWQADEGIDRVLLGLLLACVALPLLAAVLRGAGRGLPPPLSPTALVGVLAALTAALVAYRIGHAPGPARTTVKIGPVLALVALATIAVGSARAFLREMEPVSPESPPDRAPDGEPPR